MTYKRFIEECNKRTIAPNVAMENELIVTYLATKQDDLVLAILDEDF
jgi:hypothetical protein